MFRKFAGSISAAALVIAVGCGQTDAGITTAVKGKLAADDTVKAYQVDVDTRNGVVTLSGNVDNPAAKTMAVQLARDTDGVRDVIDQIAIGEPVGTSGDLDVDAPDVDADVDVDVDDDVERETREGAAATKEGARNVGQATADGAKRVGQATADGAKKVGQATADGARKVGGAVRDAVTDDDRDSDNDGK